jgi:hypothetical protein
LLVAVDQAVAQMELQEAQDQQVLLMDHTQPLVVVVAVQVKAHKAVTQADQVVVAVLLVVAVVQEHQAKEVVVVMVFQAEATTQVAVVVVKHQQALLLPTHLQEAVMVVQVH